MGSHRKLRKPNGTMIQSRKMQKTKALLMKAVKKLCKSTKTSIRKKHMMTTTSTKNIPTRMTGAMKF